MDHSRNADSHDLYGFTDRRCLNLLPGFCGKFVAMLGRTQRKLAWLFALIHVRYRVCGFTELQLLHSVALFEFVLLILCSEGGRILEDGLSIEG